MISRLRHRQSGILVTTSMVRKQAYEEIRQDCHPVVILCGWNLAVILMEKGLNSAEQVQAWLDADGFRAPGPRTPVAESIDGSNVSFFCDCLPGLFEHLFSART
jgi:hypothetical protein